MKGTAWIAGFPLANTVVPLPVGNATRDDYVGVSMDLGFRLAKFATTRFMAVSVELLWWLAYSKGRDGPPWVETINVRYLQRHELKGVGETAYPVFVIDLGASSLEAAEDAILAVQPLTPDGVKDFCRKFIEQHGVPRSLPFLFSKCAFADDYAERLQKFDEIIDGIFAQEVAALGQGIEGSETANEDFLRSVQHLQLNPSAGNDLGG